MRPIDATLHVVNLFVPALLLGALAPALAKLLWRRELAAVRWTRLAAASCTVCAAVALVGLVAFGHDGRMATYATMVAGCAITLWWRGFGPGRR
jgi:TctA family transporter